MSERRFTNKPELNPGDVWSLPKGHPAMVEDRTLFPSTVVTVTEDAPDRLLISGHSNRKLGATVEKGKLKGYALYSLSLEERATCPADCSARAFCYGNGMQMARRHRIGDPDVFFDRLGFEIAGLLDEHGGLLIRLHVLGDFPSVEYVAFWKEVLDEHPKVAIFGYTHRTDKDEIGQAIASVKSAHPERFRIRWSSDAKQADGAVVLDFVPPTPRVKGAFVCPAQTDATACCATCALCWDMVTRKDAVAFIKHGRPSNQIAAEKAMNVPNVHSGTLPATRAIAAITMPPNVRLGSVPTEAPTLRLIAPTDLRIEAAYQRDLSGKSIKLIRKIVAEWSWAKFKPPIVAETSDGLFVIDGQHTAIAAATNPSIKEIPVIIAPAAQIEKRADAFVAHNRDRLNMTPLQIFHAQIASGDKTANQILRIIVGENATVPRSAPNKGYAKPGQVVAITAAERIYKARGPEFLARVIRICVQAQIAPMSSTILYGLQGLAFERWAALAALPDAEISSALASVKNIERAAQRLSSEIGQDRYRACTMLIAKAAGLGEADEEEAYEEPDEDDLAFRLEQVEAALKDDIWIPFAWGLSPSEVVVMNVLARKELATKEAILTILYGDRIDGGAEPKIVDVFVCKIRPKVAPHGIEIKTQWGQGFYLTPESRAIVKGLQEAREAA